MLDVIYPEMLRLKIQEPLLLIADVANKYDIDIKISGGGVNSQAEAARLAVARCLVNASKKFEKLFEKKFPKNRPEFLRRSNGRKLELDGYNEELEIAFEYQGKQHYEYLHCFHRQRKISRNSKRGIDINIVYVGRIILP